ncbi:hypothetical protein AVEN_143520-1 [Araneus ventricosus]|uniref:Secreted protein n=1 Tax=Araneus ventricosus TaxID=182803 RepID=A0A4Y2HZK3_ARAVE|nr:hypothetical protein AVEN_143520-1 [Araneus ventricosus]
MLPVLLLNLQLVLGGGKEFPDPQKEWRMCGMPRPAFVCDPHFILPRGDGEASHSLTRGKPASFAENVRFEPRRIILPG